MKNISSAEELINVEEVESDEELKQMIQESLAAYKRGDFQTTSELIQSLKKEL